MASITLNKLVKRYANHVVAVNEISLHIEDGSFVVLVGPSGCGKTTVLRMLAGLEEITSGELYMDGVLANEILPKDRNVAMVFQNYALYPHMNAFQNMEFGLKMRKMKKEERRERVLQTARLLQIEELLSRRPFEMSGGQRQRVALGRAMVRDPKIFLLDEPLSNLDAALRTETRYSICKLHKQLSATFVYVTHDQTEAMTMADQMVVMRDGRIEQADSPERIYAHPANLFVAQFIGFPKINVFPAQIMEEQGMLWLSLLGRKHPLPVERFPYEELKSHVGKPAFAGIRAEEIRLDPSSEDKATMDFLENMGAETLVHLVADESPLIVKTSGKPDVKPGQEIGIRLNFNQIHLFDGEDESNLIPHL